MALQPVSSVLPARTNNVLFSGRKNESDDRIPTISSSSTAAIKAIPVAVLIAMSPLNKINAENSYEAYPSDNVELVDQNQYGDNPAVDVLRMPTKHIQFSHNPKIINVYNHRVNPGLVYEVREISTDGNDKNFELVEMVKKVDDKVKRRYIVMAYMVGQLPGEERKTYIKGMILPLDDLSSYQCKGHARIDIQEGPALEELMEKIVTSKRNNSEIGAGREAFLKLLEYFQLYNASKYLSTQM